MKRILFTIILLIFAVNTKTFASGKMDFGVSVGLAVPNDEVANVLNKDKIESENFSGTLYEDAMNTGYHLSAKLRFNLAKNLKFYGGAGINRFPQTDILVRDPETDELLGTLKTTINVVPINTGVNWYLFEKRIGLYVIGDLTYNYIASSLDIVRKNDDVAIPVSTSETENTIGYGLGAGFDIDIFLGRVNLEAKYNRINIISFEDQDKKDYVTVTAGINF